MARRARGLDTGIREVTNKDGTVSFQADIFRDGMRHYATFPKKSQARQWRELMKAQVIARKLGMQPATPLAEAVRTGPEPTLFEDAVEDFCKANKALWGHATEHRYYRATFSQVWEPTLRGKFLTAITTIDLQAVINSGIERGLSHRSLQVHRHVMRALYRWAGEQGLVVVNPTLAVKLPRAKASAPLRALRLAEMQAIVRVAPTEYRLLVLVLCLTGLRRSEVYRMTWDWVDFARGLLCVLEGKTGSHEIPLPPLLLEAMRKAHTALPPQPATNKAPQYVFSLDGLPVDHRKTLWAICKAAGVPEAAVGYHSFRRGFGTALEKIADGSAVQRLLRHSKNSRGTTGLYTVATEEEMREAVTELEKRLLGASNVHQKRDAA